MTEFNIGCCLLAIAILFTQVFRVVRSHRRHQQHIRLLERLMVLRERRKPL